MPSHLTTYSFQGLRALVAFAVMFQHISGIEGYVARSNDLGICILFMMSGFLLANRPLQPWKVFISDKLAKLAPLNTLCLTWMLLLSLGNLAYFLPRVVVDLLMLQSWIPLHSFYFSGNPVAWFLSSLMFCYTLYPALARCQRSHPKAFATAWCVGAIVAAALATAFISGSERLMAFVYVAPYSRIFDFAIGMIVGRACAGRTFDNNDWQTAAFIICAATFAASIYVPEALYLSSWWYIPVALLLVSVSQETGSDGFLARALSWRPLIVIGNISFAIFMLHLPIYHTLRILLNKAAISLDTMTTFLLVAILSTLTAHIATKYFITPAKKYIIKRL